MQVDGEENIYAIGDLAYYEEPDKENRPTPQIVQAADKLDILQRKILLQM